MTKEKSVNEIENELEEYGVSMSDQMRSDLENNKEKRHRTHIWCIIGALILTVGVIFYFAKNQEGNSFLSIYLDQQNLYKKGIDLSQTGDFTYVCSHLTSDKPKGSLVSTEKNISDDLYNQVEGNHMGKGYMAYSFYIRNAGWENSGYKATLKVNSISRHSEKAMRAKVWLNDRPVVCKIDSDHGKIIYEHKEKNFLEGYVDKFTIAVWMEKKDPTFRDDMKNEKPEMILNIDPL